MSARPFHLTGPEPNEAAVLDAVLQALDPKWKRSDRPGGPWAAKGAGGRRPGRFHQSKNFPPGFVSLQVSCS